MQMIYDSEAYMVLQMQLPSTPFTLGAAPASPSPDTDATPKAHPDPAHSAQHQPSEKKEALPQLLVRDGFEIVDKRMGREVYLDGSWAEHFKKQIDAWQQKSPTHDEIEFVLDGYAQLASHPVRVH